MDYPKRRWSGIDSRSKKVACFWVANWRESVIFPHCLGPNRAVTWERWVAVISLVRYSFRSSMETLQHENSDFNSEFSKDTLRLFRKPVDENLYEPRTLPLPQKKLTFASVFWQNYQISKYHHTTKESLGEGLTEYPHKSMNSISPSNVITSTRLSEMTGGPTPKFGSSLHQVKQFLAKGCQADMNQLF